MGASALHKIEPIFFGSIFSVRGMRREQETKEGGTRGLRFDEDFDLSWNCRGNGLSVRCVRPGAEAKPGN